MYKYYSYCFPLHARIQTLLRRNLNNRRLKSNNKHILLASEETHESNLGFCVCKQTVSVWKAPRDLTEVLVVLQSYINGIFTSCFVKTSSVSVYSQGTTPPLGQDVLRYPISKALSFVNLANDVAAYHSCCAINLRRCCQVSEHCIVPELSSETKRTPNYVIGATKWTKCAEIFVVSRVWNVGHLETSEH